MSSRSTPSSGCTSHNLRRGDFEVGGFAGGGADYNDAQFWLGFFQAPENFARFSNPDHVRLMDEASVTGDVTKRAQLLAQAEMILLREMPVLPLYFGVSKNLVSTRVKGWEDNLFNITYVKNLSLEK
jgi:oligopeptide transport system substrate-binding protein